MKFKILSILAVAVTLAFTSCKPSPTTLSSSSESSSSISSQSHSPDPSPVMTQPNKGARFFEGLLDHFLKVYIPKYCKSTSYIPGSIIVTEDPTQIDTNTYQIVGEITTRYIGTNKSRKFKAIVKDDGDDNYRIQFSRLDHRHGKKWEEIPMTPFEYSTD